MATFSPKVFKHHKRNDGTYNVKIAVSHLKKRKYLDTEHYVSEAKLTRNLKIKDPVLMAILNQTLDKYRQAARELGKKIAHFDLELLVSHLIEEEEAIHFLKFCQTHIDALKADGRHKSASTLNTVRNSLVDFFGK